MQLNAKRRRGEPGPASRGGADADPNAPAGRIEGSKRMTDADKGGASFAAKASDDLDKAKHRLEEERRAAGELVEEARDAATGLGARARTMAARQGEEVRDEAVSHLRSFANAVREAGDELGRREPGIVSDVVREAAHGLERLSDTLARSSASEIFGSIRDFGRRHPGALLAGSMLAGFAIARFATTPGSGRATPSHPTETPFTGDRYGGAYASGGGAASGGFREGPAAAPGGYPGAAAGSGFGSTTSGMSGSGMSGSGMSAGGLPAGGGTAGGAGASGAGASGAGASGAGASGAGAQPGGATTTGATTAGAGLTAPGMAGTTRTDAGSEGGRS
jgi:hypothetical protein